MVTRAPYPLPPHRKKNEENGEDGARGVEGV